MFARALNTPTQPAITCSKLTIKTLEQGVKLAWTCNFIKKETLAQVFSCEFCQITKNTFLQRTHVAAVVSREKDLTKSVILREKTFDKLPKWIYRFKGVFRTIV